VRRTLPLLVLTSLLLAGCADGKDTADPLEASVTTSTSAAPAPPPPPAVYTGVCQATGGISYGIPGFGGNGQPAVCPFSQAKSGDLSGLRAAVVEVVWTPGATVTGAQLIIQSDSCWQGMAIGASGTLEQGMCDEGNVQGTSGPLRVDLDGDAIQRRGNDNLTAMVLAHGVTAGQAFTIYVTLFEGVAPSGFSAIPA
jgi:hypothetical protein